MAAHSNAPWIRNNTILTFQPRSNECSISRYENQNHYAQAWAASHRYYQQESHGHDDGSEFTQCLEDLCPNQPYFFTFWTSMGPGIKFMFWNFVSGWTLVMWVPMLVSFADMAEVWGVGPTEVNSTCLLVLVSMALAWTLTLVLTWIIFGMSKSQ